MATTFPSSPSVNQQVTSNGRTYLWTGYAWELVPQAGSSGGSASIGLVLALS